MAANSEKAIVTNNARIVIPVAYPAMRPIESCRQRIVRAFVVDPTHGEVIAFLRALEAEFDVGVLGDGRTPQRGEHRLAGVLELHDLDVVRRDEIALRVLDEAEIHRMLNQRLDFRGVAARDGA